MGVLIDTSWLIAVERELSRNPALVAQLPADPLVSSITIAELLVGLALADDEHKMPRSEFISLVQRESSILNFGIPEARAYADIAAHLRATGQRIGERDLLIAATAVANGHSILTLNLDEFSRVPGLEIGEIKAFPPAEGPLSP